MQLFLPFAFGGAPLDEDFDLEDDGLTRDSGVVVVRHALNSTFACVDNRREKLGDYDLLPPGTLEFLQELAATERVAWLKREIEKQKLKEAEKTEKLARSKRLDEYRAAREAKRARRDKKRLELWAKAAAKIIDDVLAAQFGTQ